MPYEYRKLSPKEREEIVLYRSEKGYPLHAPPHPFRDAGAYLITAANFEHKAVMNLPKRRTEFETRLLNSIKEITDDVIAWVVLANHYHILISVQSLDDVSAVLKPCTEQHLVNGISKITLQESAVFGISLLILI